MQPRPGNGEAASAPCEFTFLGNGGFSLEGDGHEYRPWGFQGGANGHVASLSLVDGATGAVTALPSKVPYHKAKAGDRLVSLGPSGVGYGDPHWRAPADVRDNLADGLIAAVTARENYGIN